ncbi:hypothetical protein GCM10027063_35090 [Promicromonospora xylanilytica]
MDSDLRGTDKKKRRPKPREWTPPGSGVPSTEAEVAEESESATPEPVDTSWMLEERERRITPRRSILWVDDHPENNAMLSESWRRDGAAVDVARSTGEAMRLLDGRRYGLIISNMARRESDVAVPDAGLQLLTQVRAINPNVPLVLYGNVGSLEQAVRAAGANLVTDSTFELTEFASGLGMFDGL